MVPVLSYHLWTDHFVTTQPGLVLYSCGAPMPDSEGNISDGESGRDVSCYDSSKGLIESSLPGSFPSVSMLVLLQHSCLCGQADNLLFVFLDVVGFVLLTVSFGSQELFCFMRSCLLIVLQQMMLVQLDVFT